jgi:hypothetical protein
MPARSDLVFIERACASPSLRSSQRLRSWEVASRCTSRPAHPLWRGGPHSPHSAGLEAPTRGRIQTCRTRSVTLGRYPRPPTATERYQIRRAQPPWVMRDRSDLHSVDDATEGLVWSADLLPRPSFLPSPGAADRDQPVAALRTSPQAAGAPRLVSRLWDPDMQSPHSVELRAGRSHSSPQWTLGQRTPLR